MVGFLWRWNRRQRIRKTAATAAQRQRLGRAGLDADQISLAMPQTGVYCPYGSEPEPSHADKVILGILNRNPDLFEKQDRKPKRLPAHFHQVGDDDDVTHPTGQEITTGSRAHAGRDHSDQAAPKRGGVKYPGVGDPASGYGGTDAIAARYPHLFTSNQPKGANTRISPLPSALRQYRELRARGGGRPQAPVSR